MSLNRILVDWLTISFKAHFFQNQLIDLLHIPDNATDVRGFLFNCDKGIYFMGVQIRWNSQNGLVVLNCSGQGCRTIETLNPGFDWFKFLYSFHEWLTTKNQNGEYIAHISRIDLAYDVFDDERITIPFLMGYVGKNKYCCLSTRKVGKIWDESDIYLGSPKSDRFLRIYDKALEQGLLYKKWIRFEMQMRNTCAMSAYLNLVKHSGDIGYVFRGILRDYVRFTTKSRDDVGNTNTSRLVTCRWWLELLDNIKGIKQLYLPGIEYNIGTLYKYIDVQVASSLKTMVALNHGDFTHIIEVIDKSQYNLKQKQLLSEYDRISKDCL